MTYLRVIGAGMLLLASAGAYADPCKIAIDSNDMMQFSAHELAVPTTCTDVEVTLRHAGQLPAKVMGHDWVLAKDSDQSAIVNAGLAAGLSHGFLPENDNEDHRRDQGGGRGREHHGDEIQHRRAGAGGALRVLLHAPGHSSVMHGKFLFGDIARVAQAGEITHYRGARRGRQSPRRPSCRTCALPHVRRLRLRRYSPDAGSKPSAHLLDRAGRLPHSPDHEHRRGAQPIPRPRRSRRQQLAQRRAWLSYPVFSPGCGNLDARW